MGRLIGIQHVHQDNGRNVENLETGANALAKGEVLEIVRIADGLHSLLVAVNQLWGVDRRRWVFRQVNGRRAENDLQASAALNGYGQAGGLLGVIYTVFVCHVCSTSCLVFDLYQTIQAGNMPRAAPQVLHGLR